MARKTAIRKHFLSLIPKVTRSKSEASGEKALIGKELQEVKERLEGFDREHIWAFTAGQSGQDFRGNPKYLFVYINKYRPDIKAYWFCDDPETIEQVKALGFDAVNIESKEGQYYISKTGVVVSEQVKYILPDGFSNIKYVNLWHGVGFKTIERRLFEGDIAMDIAKKYVKRGTFYRDHQLMTVTSPIIEEEFVNDCGVDEDKFLRTGYVRNLYQQNFEPVESFDHDIRKAKGLGPDAKLFVYAPTYRAKLGGTFTRAIPDFERLYEYCERNNILFIFKVHPNMEKEVGFLKAWEKYGDRPHFLFWDNRNDFYEIMHMMDVAIVDYSAIFSDMIAMGIKHYIRYIFDYEEYIGTVDTKDKYFERTTGQIARSMDELFAAMDNYEAYYESGADSNESEAERIARLNDLMWAYSEGKDDFERIIERTLNFEIEERRFKTLYSFDIFDTLISRKVLEPEGIFYYVKERMQEEGATVGGFPFALVHNYPAVRHSAEFNVREYYEKTQDSRKSEKIEIQFEEIFKRIAEVYELNDAQIEKLMAWELEAEYDNSIPIEENIALLKSLIERGETVVLISDMYLSKDFVKKLLEKADPKIATLPIFLSSDYGVQKTTQKLFFEVYKSFEPYYDFEKWIHYGDNPGADEYRARMFEISTRKIERPEPGEIQQSMIESIGTYDTYLVAAMQARMAQDNYFVKDDFVISFVALCFVPYVDWAIRDAQRRGYETLYFISRDGHHLKRIADAIIKRRGLNIKTKYIYGSRRLWKIPSYIKEIDEGFWGTYGNFVDLQSKEKLFGAMDLNEEKFVELFPYIDADRIDFENKDEMTSLVEIFENSKAYHEYLLGKAAEERVIVDDYLRQEIDPSEKFAVIEYWGRGHNQECLNRLWRNLTGDEEATIPYYYSRSILQSMDGNIRHNFTTNENRMVFCEAFFANMPYKSVEEYRYVTDDDGKGRRVEPVIVPVHYQEELFSSMERLLPEFADRYAALELKNPEDTDHLLYEFVFKYFKENSSNPKFAEEVGTLHDSVALYGTKREFAPAYTEENLDKFFEKEQTRGQGTVTTNIVMSVTRTEGATLERYNDLYQILPGDPVDEGRVLDADELKMSLDNKKKYKELAEKAKKFAKIYEECLNEAVSELGESKPAAILFVGNGKRISGGTLRRVIKALDARLRSGAVAKAHAGLSYEELPLGDVKSESDMRAAAKKIAHAKFIIASEPVHLLAMTNLTTQVGKAGQAEQVGQNGKVGQSEQVEQNGQAGHIGPREILLPDNPFNLYGKALGVNYFLKWREKYRKLSGTNEVSILQIPARSEEERYRRNYSHMSLTDCSLLGCCNTDMFFEDNREKVRRELETIFPEAKGKKVIFYMPMLRPNDELREWAKLIDFDELQKLVGDEYVLVFNYNKEQMDRDYQNVYEVPGFSKIIVSEMTVRELLIASDVIVGDYRDGFFESALMRKPVFSTAYDYEEMMKARNINAFDFSEYVFCPIIKSAVDLAKSLDNLDAYDYSKMQAFREEMFSGCDGHSTERVVDYCLANI